MLIIEGADSLGKTTAAKRLVELAAKRVVMSLDELTEPPETFQEYPIRYAHMSRPNPAFDFFLDYRDLMSTYAVQDRFHLGSLVWHRDVMCQAHLRVIESWLLQLGTVTVVMTCDDEIYPTVLESDKKGQMFDRKSLINANQIYYQIAVGMHRLRPLVDIHYHAKTMLDLYPDDGQLETWLDIWFERLTPIPRF